MGNLRQQLADRGALKSELVTLVGADGETMVVEVRELTAGARGRVLNTCMITRAVEGGDETESVPDQEKIGPALVIASARDPQTHELIFGEADAEMVANLSSSVVDPIVKVCMRVSGLTGQAAKSAEKNSAPTTSSDSTSPSPANSE